MSKKSRAVKEKSMNWLRFQRYFLASKIVRFALQFCRDSLKLSNLIDITALKASYRIDSVKLLLTKMGYLRSLIFSNSTHGWHSDGISNYKNCFYCRLRLMWSLWARPYPYINLVRNLGGRGGLRIFFKLPFRFVKISKGPPNYLKKTVLASHVY